MSCTKIYVQPTDTLTYQERKSILVSNIQSLRYCSLDVVLLNSHYPFPSIRNALMNNGNGGHAFRRGRAGEGDQ